jgi:choline-glycine betaine transporter
MAAIAGILLVAGGLGALQSASVLFGVPFAFIMVAMCVSIYMHLRDEARETTRRERGETDLTVHRRGGASPAGGQAFTAEKPPDHGRLTNPGNGRREDR